MYENNLLLKFIFNKFKVLKVTYGFFFIETSLPLKLYFKQFIRDVNMFYIYCLGEAL